MSKELSAVKKAARIRAIEQHEAGNYQRLTAPLKISDQAAKEAAGPGASGDTIIFLEEQYQKAHRADLQRFLSEGIRFADIESGERFEFIDSEDWQKDLERGPWLKLSPRKFKKAEPDPSSKIDGRDRTIGTVQSKVRRVRAEPPGGVGGTEAGRAEVAAMLEPLFFPDRES